MNNARRRALHAAIIDTLADPERNSRENIGTPREGKSLNEVSGQIAARGDPPFSVPEIIRGFSMMHQSGEIFIVDDDPQVKLGDLRWRILQ